MFRKRFFSISLLLATSWVFVLSGSAAAEESVSTDFDETKPKWTVQVDPLTFYIGFAHLQFERAFSKHVSIYAGPHARLFSGPGFDKEDFLGFGLEAGVRWFPWGVAPEGAWAQIRGVGAYIFTDENETFGGYVSMLAGYTAIFSGWFVLSGGAGFQYLHYYIDGLGPKTFAPALHTTLGVAF